jgi:ribosomal protein L22
MADEKPNEEEAAPEQAPVEETPVVEAEAEAEAEAEVPAEKPKRRRSKKAAAADDKAAPKPARARGAEVTAGRQRRTPRREPGEKVIVRAKARYVRCAPRKARLVVDHIRGKSVDEARAILIHTPRAASRDVLKLLDSAIANAENNHELVADELKIDRVFVDEGPTLKRFRPRALGRATQIRKRTSHMTILLTPKE